MSNYDLNRHKKNDKIKWIATGVAVILLAGACATTIAMGVKNNGWFKKDEDPKIEQTATGGMDVGEIQSNGIQLLSARIASEDYEEYGISPLAENAYTLTATVTPADAANKKVDWTIAFKNASSSWATGKTVTDYATVTPSADGSLTAVVENKAAFGEQIVVKCTSRDNRSAYATCTVEYLQRVDYTLTLDGKTYSTTGVKTNSVTPTFAAIKEVTGELVANKSTVYTRASTSGRYFTIRPTAEFETAITNAGFTASDLKTIGSITMVQEFSHFFDSSWFDPLYSNKTEKNKLIDALVAFSGNAYEIEIYSVDSSDLAKFYITLDTSVIAGQKVVEGITINQTEIEF